VGSTVDLSQADQFIGPNDTQVQEGFEHVDASGSYGITLFGDDGDNRLIGSSSNDTITYGADSIDGGGGNDTLDGAGGNDTLIGGADNDAMDGGADNDVFRYDATGFNTDDVAANQVDAITASAGDVISMLGLTDDLTIGGDALSALTADVAVGTALSSGDTNIAFVGGVLQFDLNGDGSIVDEDDFQIALTGVTTVSYNATDDLFHLS